MISEREYAWPESMRSIMAQVLQLDTISNEKTPALSLLSHVLDKASETADRLKLLRFR